MHLNLENSDQLDKLAAVAQQLLDRLPPSNGFGRISVHGARRCGSQWVHRYHGAPPCILQRRRPRTAGDWARRPFPGPGVGIGLPGSCMMWPVVHGVDPQTLRRCPHPPGGRRRQLLGRRGWTWTCSTVTFCWPFPRW